jgi:hypothetical protein
MEKFEYAFSLKDDLSECKFRDEKFKILFKRWNNLSGVMNVLFADMI